MSRSKLLVYLADPSRPGERWLDQGNDPEMRLWPMTWGICRTDARIQARVGDDLFFVAFGANRPTADRYYLAAQFRVAQKIGWAEAVERFAGRPNVIIEPLPPGPSLDERVVRYVSSHRHELRWAGGRRVVSSLVEGDRWLREHARDLVIELDGSQFIHAHYDGHSDWRTRRLDGPYLVADTAVSKVLAKPIPYVELATGCAELPPFDRLRTRGRRPRHNQRRLSPTAAGYLLARVAIAKPLDRIEAPS